VSVRKFDNPRNRVLKAYLYKPNQQPKLFYCREQIIKNIINPIGDLIGDGERFLITNNDLNFMQNDFVKVLGETKMLTIEGVVEEINEHDKNSLRGKPRYEKRLHVK